MHCSNSPLIVLISVLTTFSFLGFHQLDHVHAPEGSQISNHNQYSMQPQSTLQRSNSHYDHETTVNGQTLRSDYSDVNELQFVDKNYLSGVQTQQFLHHISSQVNGALRLNSPGHNNETEVNNVNSSANNMLESQELYMEEFSSNSNKSSVEVSNNVHNSTQSVTGTVSDTVLTESCVAERHNAYAVGKSVEVISYCQVKGFTQLILAVMKSNEKSGLLADNEARDLGFSSFPLAGCYLSVAKLYVLAIGDLTDVTCVYMSNGVNCIGVTLCDDNIIDIDEDLEALFQMHLAQAKAKFFREAKAITDELVVAALSAKKSQVSFYDIFDRLTAHEILLQNARKPISIVVNVAR
ncbi:hypothetical protein CQW23_01021 [Capsicum baccatum]|uniref:Uncharacterized protein n=1 Tax=Capsicum baccatum TaxID=33114 RepID=A0A2G2XME0_CAPBA|nr:hypothetical protein CQW23_01021 [Capsicum baccatum]